MYAVGISGGGCGGGGGDEDDNYDGDNGGDFDDLHFSGYAYIKIRVKIIFYSKICQLTRVYSNVKLQGTSN